MKADVISEHACIPPVAQKAVYIGQFNWRLGVMGIAHSAGSSEYTNGGFVGRCCILDGVGEDRTWPIAAGPNRTTNDRCPAREHEVRVTTTEYLKLARNRSLTTPAIIIFARDDRGHRELHNSS